MWPMNSPDDMYPAMMSAAPNLETDPSSRRAQLKAVLWMRSLAVSLMGLLLLLGYWTQGVQLPLPTLVFVLGLLLLLNLLGFARLRFTPAHIGPYEVATQLFADLFGFSIMLYFTGGATNPFVMFYLPLLGLAAALLPLGQVMSLAMLSVVAYTLLTLEYVPLVLRNPDNAVQLHLFGMWVNFLLSVGILVGFVARLSTRLRQREHSLYMAENRLNREANLAALGNQSAALAHEMGTPLSAIKTTVSDWLELPTQRQMLTGVPELEADMQRIQQQVGIMQSSLVRLRQQVESFGNPTRSAHQPNPAALQQWFEQVLARWHNRHPEVQLKINSQLHAEARYQLALDDLTLSLNVLLDNCAQMATGELPTPLCVQCELQPWSGGVVLVVADNGKGFSAIDLPRLGKELLSERPTGRGMGLYLIGGLIERLGGQMLLRNRPEGGAEVRLRWPAKEVTA